MSLRDGVGSILQSDGYLFGDEGIAAPLFEGFVRCIQVAARCLYVVHNLGVIRIAEEGDGRLVIERIQDADGTSAEAGATR